jgi:hypothetical protein
MKFEFFRRQAGLTEISRGWKLIQTSNNKPFLKRRIISAKESKKKFCIAVFRKQSSILTSNPGERFSDPPFFLNLHDKYLKGYGA